MKKTTLQIRRWVLLWTKEIEEVWCMYTIEDLFDKRSVVGTKLEQIMFAEGCTKSELCKKAGVSRPTFDKLLAGTLTNKTNYEKHNLDRARNQLKLVSEIEKHENLFAHNDFPPYDHPTFPRSLG